MKSIAVVWVMILALGVLVIFDVKASDEMQTSRSAGKLKHDQSADLKSLMRQREPVSKPRPLQAENFVASEQAQALIGIANRHDQLFTIFEADVQVLSDIDGDGYHHAINVYFDVDVNLDGAAVYAKLYLSRDGGPWSQYYTTDLFDIYFDDHEDAFEVETELLDGYPAGYYDVLVEIYSLDHAHMVTSEVLDYHYLGKDIMLEDLSRDEVDYDAGYTSYSVTAGGSSAGALLWFLLFAPIVIAARGFLALTPCKKRK